MVNYISALNNNKFSAPRPDGTEISTIVITYSVREGKVDKTITKMHDTGSSVHYTIGNGYMYSEANQTYSYNPKYDGYIDQYHNEDKKAFYAGVSSWKGVSGVNDYAIGIMIINDAQTPFTEAQFERLVALIKDIQERHGKTMDVVGLGEVNKKHIAPHFSLDWNKLSDAGIGKKITLPEGTSKECILNLNDQNDKVLELQNKLIAYGYGVNANGLYDNDTKHFVEVFSVRYLQEDAKCASEAIFMALDQILGITAQSEL